MRHTKSAGSHRARWVALLIALSTAIWGASPASAAYTIKDYEQFKDVDLFKMYLTGVGQGFAWANAYLYDAKQLQLFCQPELLSLGVDNYKRIIDDELARRRKEYMKMAGGKGAPIEFILLSGLKRTFPCK